MAAELSHRSLDPGLFEKQKEFSRKWKRGVDSHVKSKCVPLGRKAVQYKNRKRLGKVEEDLSVNGDQQNRVFQKNAVGPQKSPFPMCTQVRFVA